MKTQVAIKKPNQENPVRLTVDIMPDGRLQMLDGTRLINSLASLSKVELAAIQKSKKYDNIPDDCFFRLGENAGGVIVYTAAEWDAMDRQNTRVKLADAMVMVKHTKDGFVLCVRQDVRAATDVATIKGATLTLGESVEVTTDHYGRKLDVRQVSSWEIINADENNYKWWKQLYNDLYLDGREDYESKHAAEDFSRSMYGQEKALFPIINALATPLNEFLAGCRKDISRESSGGVCLYFSKYARKAINAYMRGERDLDKLKAIMAEIDNDSDYIEATLGM